MSINKINVVTIVFMCAISLHLYNQLQDVKENQTALINALGSAGILEQKEEGAEIIINKVVRLKDVPQQ